jgi:hypothetical protein
MKLLLGIEVVIMCWLVGPIAHIKGGDRIGEVTIRNRKPKYSEKNEHRSHKWAAAWTDCPGFKYAIM